MRITLYILRLNLAYNLSRFTKCSNNRKYFHNLQANNATAVEALTSVSASTSSLLSCSLAHQAAHDSTRCAAREELDALQLDLDDALQNLERLEGRYLSQEYKVYEPTGKKGNLNTKARHVACVL